MKSPDATTDMIRMALAQRRVSSALLAVEKAQHALDEACVLLSTIQYGHPAQKRVRRVRKLWESVRLEWYRLRPLHDDQRIRIDRDPTDEERARFAGDAS